MIGWEFPHTGLEPFCKKFGQPLHEKHSNDKTNDKTVVSKLKVDNPPDNDKFIVKKALEFDYDDSEDEESDSTDADEIPDDDKMSNIGEDPDDEKLSSNGEIQTAIEPVLNDMSDILPPDAPEDTINTLQALQAHIHASENRQFTNLERQLLATIVQHGILNSNSGRNESKITADSKQPLDSELQVNDTKNDTTSTPRGNVTDSCVSNDTSHIPATSLEITHNMDESPKLSDSTKVVISCSPDLLNITPDIKKDTSESMKQIVKVDKIIFNSPETVAKKRVLLPTPVSRDEKPNSLVTPIEKDISLLDEQRKSMPDIDLKMQKKMKKQIGTCNLPKRVTTNSYHPDDKPTLDLLQPLDDKNDNSPAYEDLLSSFVSTKNTIDNNAEVKTNDKSGKTTIIHRSSIRPSESNRYFQGRRVVHREEYYEHKRHERIERFERSGRSDRGGRSDLTKWSDAPAKSESKRRVKVVYKEEKTNEKVKRTESHTCAEDRRNNKRKRLTPERDTQLKNRNNKDQSAAVDILADLITQKVLNKINDADGVEELLEMNSTNNEEVDNIKTNQNTHNVIIPSESTHVNNVGLLPKPLPIGFPPGLSSGLPMGLPPFFGIPQLPNMHHAPLNPMGSFHPPPFSVNDSQSYSSARTNQISISSTMGQPDKLKDKLPAKRIAVDRSNLIPLIKDEQSSYSDFTIQMEFESKLNDVNQYESNKNKRNENNDSTIPLTVHLPSLPDTVRYIDHNNQNRDIIEGGMTAISVTHKEMNIDNPS